uniref:Uncharacterized protein n=1 Tax=Chromera velia CCMP2878 TaxID=1169474 RepID=A0A0G4F5E6_9ALVE|eukprot:Cvel_15310.t1-p1 / transcript=Cvel_15310.t1 / gene=Cvel_15310 / organism=Chromera_velia_CCMP2878 / gene_product=hypothetical protein / transcript_product=hypothetical protein / location=Cvel_scaffold1125:2831-15583(+) / protein_length=1112 / sequence_SO=supercontig / SO=protein_coding / is_pseudo=false
MPAVIPSPHLEDSRLSVREDQKSSARQKREVTLKIESDPEAAATAEELLHTVAGAGHDEHRVFYLLWQAPTPTFSWLRFYLPDRPMICWLYSLVFVPSLVIIAIGTSKNRLGPKNLIIPSVTLVCEVAFLMSPHRSRASLLIKLVQSIISVVLVSLYMANATESQLVIFVRVLIYAFLKMLWFSFLAEPRAFSAAEVVSLSRQRKRPFAVLLGPSTKASHPQSGSRSFPSFLSAASTSSENARGNPSEAGAAWDRRTEREREKTRPATMPEVPEETLEGPPDPASHALVGLSSSSDAAAGGGGVGVERGASRLLSPCPQRASSREEEQGGTLGGRQWEGNQGEPLPLPLRSPPSPSSSFDSSSDSLPSAGREAPRFIPAFSQQSLDVVTGDDESPIGGKKKEGKESEKIRDGRDKAERFSSPSVYVRTGSLPADADPISQRRHHHSVPVDASSSFSSAALWRMLSDIRPESPLSSLHQEDFDLLDEEEDQREERKEHTATVRGHHPPPVPKDRGRSSVVLLSEEGKDDQVSPKAEGGNLKNPPLPHPHPHSPPPHRDPAESDSPAKSPLRRGPPSLPHHQLTSLPPPHRIPSSRFSTTRKYELGNLRRHHTVSAGLSLNPPTSHTAKRGSPPPPPLYGKNPKEHPPATRSSSKSKTTRSSSTANKANDNVQERSKGSSSFLSQQTASRSPGRTTVRFGRRWSSRFSFQITSSMPPRRMSASSTVDWGIKKKSAYWNAGSRWVAVAGAQSGNLNFVVYPKELRSCLAGVAPQGCFPTLARSVCPCLRDPIQYERAKKLLGFFLGVADLLSDFSVGIRMLTDRKTAIGSTILALSLVDPAHIVLVWGSRGEPEAYEQAGVLLLSLLEVPILVLTILFREAQSTAVVAVSIALTVMGILFKAAQFGMTYRKKLIEMAAEMEKQERAAAEEASRQGSSVFGGGGLQRKYSMASSAFWGQTQAQQQDLGESTKGGRSDHVNQGAGGEGGGQVQRSKYKEKHERRKARKQVLSLRYTGTVDDCNKEFSLLALKITNTSEDDLVEDYIEGLPAGIMYETDRIEPATLDEAMEKVLDSEIWLKQASSRSRSRWSRGLPSDPSPVIDPTGPAPMELYGVGV